MPDLRQHESDDSEEAVWKAEREAMVRTLRRYGITDERILAAMGRIPRHRFIPPEHRRHDTAYADHPWTIGHGQTISQPYIVAYMIGRLQVRTGDRVLEVGVGSGYQAAVLAEIGARVFGVECIPELAEHARAVLAAEGYAGRISVRTGDGHAGWAEESPFDAIVTACAPETIPPALLEQLSDGGRMILPLGGVIGFQRLVLVHRSGDHLEQIEDLPVRFVPMVTRG